MCSSGSRRGVINPEQMGDDWRAQAKRAADNRKRGELLVEVSGGAIRASTACRSAPRRALT